LYAANPATINGNHALATFVLMLQEHDVSDAFRKLRKCFFLPEARNVGLLFN